MVTALAIFLPVCLGWIPFGGVTVIFVDVLAAVGIGVVLGLMAFGFLGLKTAKMVAAAAVVLAAPFTIGFLHDYAVLSGWLVAYAVSTLVCFLMCFRDNATFDFDSIESALATSTNVGKRTWTLPASSLKPGARAAP